MASQEYFRFLDLPFDVRIMILRYLLPDQHFILHEAYKTDVDRLDSQDRIVGDSLKGPPTWSTFDYKYWSPYPDILLTNRQVYSEGFYYLYTLKSFKLVIYHQSFSGYEFLTRKHYWLLQELQPVPYHAMKEFILEIRGHDMRTTVCQFRKQLIELLRHFHNQEVHFKKLRIQFPDPLGPLPGWDHAWDSAEPKAWDCKPEIEVNEDTYDIIHQELTARDSGAPSTFAWLLSVFATCPSLADECIIELPKTLRDKPHMQACGKRYAEGLDGRSSFKLEDECCLKQDLYVLNHENGYREDCNCEVCDVRTRLERMEAVHQRLYDYRYRWMQIRWHVKYYAYHIWSSWKPYDYALKEKCECASCTRDKEQEQEGRALYLEKLARGVDDDNKKDDEDLQRCPRPDHMRRRLMRDFSREWDIFKGPRPRIEECEDCMEAQEKSLRAQGLFADWCLDEEHMPQKAKKGLWRGLCEYPRDVWMSWKPEADLCLFWHAEEDCKSCGGRIWEDAWTKKPEDWYAPKHGGYCDGCRWERTGGWMGKNTLRSSYLARWGLVGCIVWENMCDMVLEHISPDWEERIISEID
ncbi:MAG: hypothetical protein L6R38_007432 [Xanthoria sp. 2 TBL-2021]|nr:MAG: hypothetical protein L6R38_007432 [Xanthoria sp. 2 TBL-2021]